jgi:acyl-CoA oxidase
MAPTPDWVKQLKPSGPQGHELLAAERAKSSVPVEKLQELLFTKEIIDRKQKVLDILKSEQVFDKSQNYFAGRTERFETALARAKRLRNLRLKHNWSLDEYRMANELISEPGPYGLHDSMFLVAFLCLFTNPSCTNSCRSPLLNKALQNSMMSF